jgi:flagellar biosynthetic protein FliO
MSLPWLVSLQATPAAAPEPGLDAIRAVLALAAVVAALVAFLWLLKRGTFAAMRRGGGPALAIESAISLGDRRSLVIVTVEGRRLLLGASPAQVALITELQRAPAGFGSALDGALAPPREGGRQ